MSKKLITVGTMGKKDNLGEFEQLMLLALLRLRNKAYGMTIRREISERTGRDVSIGSVYTTLARLETKGFVKSHQGEPTPQRGGRAKRYFQITGQGELALNRSLFAVDSMRRGLRPSEA